jgi:hypothetical protein
LWISADDLRDAADEGLDDREATSASERHATWRSVFGDISSVSRHGGAFDDGRKTGGKLSNTL